MPEPQQRLFWTISRRYQFLALGSLLIASLGFGSILWVQSLQEQAGLRTRVEKRMVSMHDASAEKLVRFAVSELQAVVAMRDAGRVTDEQARLLGAKLLRDARYSTDGYFWVDTFEGRNVVLLGSDQEGKNRLDLIDIHGKPFIRDLIDAGRQGGGIVEYWFPRPGTTEPVRKRSFALAFEPFRWVVGTGNYLDDVEAAIAEESVHLSSLVQTVSWSVGLMVFVLIIAISAGSLWIGVRIGRPIEELLSALENLAQRQPDLNFQLPSRFRGDVGLLADAFNRVMGRLRLAFAGESAYAMLTKKLAMLADAHDTETADHTTRVGDLSALLARELGFEAAEAEALRRAATLHDVGKLFVDPQLIRKEGPLSTSERENLKQHTLFAERLLEGELFHRERTVALYHHERYDGSGYPFGLKGEGIPLEAQIVGVADVFDALRSARPYKNAFEASQALHIMRHGDARMTGGGFNPRILAIVETNLDRIDREIYGVRGMGSGD